MFRLLRRRTFAREAKSCAVYFRGDAIYVISQSLTNHGRVAKDPMVKLPKTAAAFDLGRAVLDALAAFSAVDGLPPPTHLADFLRFVGAPSWRKFATGTLEIAVTFDGRELHLRPSRADSKGAFLYEESFTACRPEPATLGVQVLALAADG